MFTVNPAAKEKNALQQLASAAGKASSAVIKNGMLQLSIPLDKCGVLVSKTGKTYSFRTPTLAVQGVMDGQVPLFVKNEDGSVSETGQVVELNDAKVGFGLTAYADLKSGTVKEAVKEAAAAAAAVTAPPAPVAAPPAAPRAGGVRVAG